MDGLEVLLSEDQIQEKVAGMAEAISRAYGQRTVHLVGLLENSFIFMADLVRKLTCPVACHFTKLEMKDVVENGHERRLIAYTPPVEVTGRDILVVDCVLQTGVTHDHLMQQFVTKGASSVKLAVLIDKSDERHVSLQPDFYGFQLQGHFLVGYGMGFRDQYRNLSYVGTLKRSAEEPRVVSAAVERKE